MPIDRAAIRASGPELLKTEALNVIPLPAVAVEAGNVSPGYVPRAISGKRPEKFAGRWRSWSQRRPPLRRPLGWQSIRTQP